MNRSPTLVIPTAQNENSRVTSDIANTNVDPKSFDSAIENDERIVEVTSSNLPKNEVVRSLMSSRLKVRGNVVRTIHNTEIPLSYQNPIPVSTWKNRVCHLFPNLIHSDIMLVRCGKLLSNEEIIGDSTNGGKAETYMLLSTKANKFENVVFRSQDGDKSMDVPLNIKISSLKKELYSKKITPLKPELQRLIVDGKVLKDYSILGDYLISAVRSDILREPSTKLMKKHRMVVHISKTMDPKHEVDITVKLNEKKSLQLSFELSKPIGLILDILHKKYMFPLPNQTSSFVFYLPQPHSKQMLELDMNKCLIDYGFTNSTKALTLEIARMDHSINDTAQNVQMTISIDQILNMMMCCVYAAHEFVEKKIPLEPKESLRSLGSGKRPIESSTSLSAVVPIAQPNNLPSKIEQTKRSKCENEMPSASSALFKGLKKGFLQSSTVDKVVQKNGSSVAGSSKKQISDQSGLFQGMKKGFLATNDAHAKKRS
mmetsp:Transcript_21395/g.29446  ORF Transcript_21395/g.29446 Transcript_21395/m.29446 type:complete len:485 (+) Transcript_21395:35-1489(+)|eukprot:CAMPEP_0170082626 /NCGR_PEP_ID=MMETSP0019_2-20121128/18153_1 /TAXON_ID=98059 /ORGANISM="Dinobryon sp., Strain UTEXLB2267" /LENGTH=484 /DNA_ID=CAMNT_0010297563 /DNA_START=14 /DNA_END=1468 /DNA_ORIENTATION=+